MNFFFRKELYKARALHWVVFVGSRMNPNPKCIIPMQLYLAIRFSSIDKKKKKPGISIAFNAEVSGNSWYLMPNPKDYYYDE